MRLALVVITPILALSCQMIGVPTPTEPQRLGNVSQRTNEPGEISDRRWDELARLALEKGLTPLVKTSINPTDFEMRVWTLGEEGLEKCLIARRDSSRWSVKTVLPRFENGELLVDSKGNAMSELKVIEIGIQDSRLDSLLRDEGLAPPMRFRRDGKHEPPVIDEVIIAIEVKDGKYYDVVDYRAFSQTPDAMAVKQICRKLSQLYDVSLDCGY